MKDENLYIIHIAECIQRIKDYTQAGKNAFLQTQIIQDAVARNFEIMGEATKCLSSEFRARYPDIPWREMAGFRDVLIHDYINIDLDQVWEIIETDLNELEQSIGEILNELGIKFPNHSQ